MCPVLSDTFTLLPSVNSREPLECYRCAGLHATLNGTEDETSTEITEELVDALGELYGIPFGEDCLSHDVTDLQQFASGQICSGEEMCGYLNASLTNENYLNRGELVMTMVIRQCQVSVVPTTSNFL